MDASAPTPGPLAGPRPAGPRPDTDLHRQRRRLWWHIVLWTFLISWLLAYGGVRSPDSEVVVRTAQALAERGSFALEAGTPWRGFGMAPGRDGRLYGHFGPVQSLAMAPAVALVDWIQRSRWYDQGFRAPVPSHYVGEGLRAFMTGSRPLEPRAHALRFLLSWFNPAVTALTAGVLFLLLARLTASAPAAAATAALYGLGTLALPYAGTFFSEPLAALGSVVSLYLLLPATPERGPWRWRALAAGLCLGLATATHLTAVLFAPFFLVVAVCGPGGSGRCAEQDLRAGVAYCGAVALVLAALAYFNYARFGDPLETGRTVPGLLLEYGHFGAPWGRLPVVLWCGGRGLLWYCPAVVLGLVGLNAMRRQHPTLAGVVAATVVGRILFVAARTDWHGGFNLGPRYLVMLIPFMLMPWAYVLAAGLGRRRGRWLVASGLSMAACVIEQLYFCTGEVFSYQHWIKWVSIQQDVDVFTTELIYRSWQYAPLLHLLAGRRGPWTLQTVPLSNFALWGVLAGLASVAVGVVWMRWYRAGQSTGARGTVVSAPAATSGPTAPPCGGTP